MRRLAGLLPLLLGAFIVAPAFAQAPIPAPAPAPVQTQMTLKVDRAVGRATTFVGARLRIRGTVGAFAPGEVIVVRFYVTGRKLAVKRVKLQGRADGTGAFMLSHRPIRPGILTVRATHEASPALGAFAARGRAIDVIPRRVTSSSGRSSISALQRRLRALGYVIGAPGVFDGRTARAVLAFRKVTGMARTMSAGQDLMRKIARGAGQFRVHFPRHGRHIEADLSRQVIALIDRGRVRRIYPVSSGAPSTPTVTGSFEVYLKTFGTNAKGMVHSSYFIRGYATHGYASVPVFPASHGCLRVPIPDALSLFHWIRIGTPVDVYS